MHEEEVFIIIINIKEEWLIKVLYVLKKYGKKNGTRMAHRILFVDNVFNSYDCCTMPKQEVGNSSLVFKIKQVQFLYRLSAK